MPTVTLRLDESTKTDLETLSRSRGQNLSDLIRSALNDLLMRGDDDDDISVAPRSLTAVERQQLALLHRILARVVGDDNDVDGDKNYQLERAQVLEGGFVGEYTTEFAGIRPELSARDSEFVLDVLDLYRITTFSIEKLKESGRELDENLIRSLRFEGFDLQDQREARLLAYARYLVGQDRWPELQYVFSTTNDRGNSHSPCSAMYQRMLDEYTKIKAETNRARRRRDSYFLDVNALQRLVDVQTHPDHQRYL